MPGSAPGWVDVVSKVSRLPHMVVLVSGSLS